MLPELEHTYININNVRIQLPWLPEFGLRVANHRFAVRTLMATSRLDTFGDADMEHYRQAWS